MGVDLHGFVQLFGRPYLRLQLCLDGAYGIYHLLRLRLILRFLNVLYERSLVILPFTSFALLCLEQEGQSSLSND